MTPHAVLLQKYLIATLLSAAVASAAPPAADPAALAAENGSLAQAYKILSSKQFVDLTPFLQPGDARVGGLWPGNLFGRCGSENRAALYDRERRVSCILVFDGGAIRHTY